MQGKCFLPVHLKEGFDSVSKIKRKDVDIRPGYLFSLVHMSLLVGDTTVPAVNTDHLSLAVDHKLSQIMFQCVIAAHPVHPDPFKGIRRALSTRNAADFIAQLKADFSLATTPIPQLALSTPRNLCFHGLASEILLNVVDTDDETSPLYKMLLVLLEHDPKLSTTIANAESEDPSEAAYCLPRNRRRPIHLAAYRGSLPFVKLLVKNRADVYARTVYRWLPVHNAAEEHTIVRPNRPGTHKKPYPDVVNFLLHEMHATTASSAITEDAWETVKSAVKGCSNLSESGIQLLGKTIVELSVTEGYLRDDI